MLVRSVPLGRRNLFTQPGAAEAAAPTETGALGTLLDAAPRAGLDLPCRSADADLWFAESPAELERAKALCAGCPAGAACLAGALEREEPWGVWGGEIFECGAWRPASGPAAGRARPTSPATGPTRQRGGQRLTAPPTEPTQGGPP